MPLYKESLYNFLVKIKEDTHLFFNGLTGAMLEVNNDEKEKIEAILKYPSCYGNNSIILKRLFEMGYLVNASFDEVEQIRMLKKHESINHRILDISISPTYSCNLRCVYCYVDFNNESFSDIDITNILQFIKANITQHKQINITWFGGEPLLCKDTIETLTREIGVIRENYSTNIYHFLTTNGYLLDIDTVKRLSNMGINYYHITIDGGKESHDKLRVISNGTGTYDTIFNNITSALKELASIYFTLRINVNSESAKNVNELLFSIPSEYRKRIQLHITPIIVEGEVIKLSLFREINSLLKDAYKIGYRYYNHIIPTYKKAFCSADKLNNFQFGPNGRVYKCSPSGKPEVYVGAFNDQGVIEFNDNYHKWLNAKVFNNNCESCRFLCFCYGGCRLNIVRSKHNVNCKREYEDIENLILNKYFALTGIPSNPF